jgi:hypothetical protein
VLGPILFLIYTLPVGKIIRRHDLPFHLFADDSQLYITFRPTQPAANNAVASVGQCVKELHQWMTKNRLKLNDDKTEVLAIGSKKQLAKIAIPQLQIGDVLIEKSTKPVRNLGTIFDENFSMAAHIQGLCKTANFHVRTIGSLCRYLTTAATTTLVHAFVTSRLDCGNSLLSGLPDTLLGKLQRVQNTAARLVKQIKRSDHITPILRELHWLPVKYRIKYKVLLLTYRVVYNIAPKYLADLLCFYTPSRSLCSEKDTLQLVVPKTNKVTFGDRAFCKVAPVLWNDLPFEIRSVTSLDTFKKLVKTHLFKQAYES